MTPRECRNDLWRLLTAAPTTPTGEQGLIYLRQLNLGGQDWGAFLGVMDAFVRRIAQSSEFHSIIPDVLELADVVHECHCRTYEKWLADYLGPELRKGAAKSDEESGRGPRPFAVFLRDRCRDYLRGISGREANRRRLEAHQAMTTPSRGAVRTAPTGAKIVLQRANDSRPRVEASDRSDATGNRFALWSNALPSPERLAELREIEAALPHDLRQLIWLLAKGWTYQEMADLFDTSEATISRRVAALLALLEEPPTDYDLSERKRARS